MAAQAKNPYAAEGGVRPLKVMEIPSRPSRSSVGRFLKAGGGLGEVNQHEATVSEKVSRQTTDIYEIATHLPDQVVICDKETRIPFVNSSVGVLMFADISGFTALCEKYSLNAKIGTDQLTKCLNGYLGAIVEHIMSSDGDVLKYAGDAILALWRLDSSGKKGVRDRYLLLQSALIQALRCAAAIQHRCGTWLTDVGVTLRVKLGISAGEVTVAYLGNDEFRHYVTFGKAVQEVNLAEKFCQSGDIVLSPSAWKYCHQFNIPHKLASDGAHIHLVDSLDHLTHNLGYFAKYTSQRTASFDDVENCSITYSANIEKPRIRKAVTEHVKSSQDQMLKLYVAKPVLRKLEDHQPLEYLSEMRQVTIVFINLTLEKVNHAKLCELLQDVFCVIYQQAKSVFGCLNKVFMFDKGCTFLVIFGLPGFKHENDCAHALQCALKTLQTLNEMDSVTEASIGVTTGPTFCGVVGHQLRHEYTVIGRKVNMAARLMMHYPGKVTCDNETFHHSKLPKTSFIKLGFKEMKGLQNVGVIREYTEAEGQQQPVRVSTEKAEEDNALLGRAEEMQQVLDEVKLMQRNVKKGGQRSIIVLAGDAGVGKTRMIQGVIQEVQKQGIKVIHTQFLIHDAKYPFGLVKNMLLQLLGLNLEHTHQEREHILLNEFDDTTLINSLWLLNDLLALKLPQPEVHVDMDTETRRAALYSLLHRIVHEGIEEEVQPILSQIASTSVSSGEDG